MLRSRCHLLLLLTLALATTVGCASNAWWEHRLRSKQVDAAKAAVGPVESPLDAAAATPPAPPHAAASSEGTGAVGPASSAQGMQQVMAQLRDLDPRAKDQIMADLQQADPALWPAMLHQARALAAYRRQHASPAVADPRTLAAAAGGSADVGVRPSAPPPSAPPPVEARYAVAASAPAYGQFVARRDGAVSPHDVRPVAMTNAGNRAPANQSPEKAIELVSRLPAARSAVVAPSDAPGQRYPQTDQPAIEDSRPDAELTEKDWQEHLRSAIARLEQQADLPGDDAERAMRQAQLRMLYLTAGRTEDAVRPIAAAPKSQQMFWSQELHGLGALLSSPASWDAAGRVAEAKQSLAQAVTELSEAAPLVVRNLAFCTAVHSYGCVEPFEQYEFSPEQRVLLYAEVENFAVEQTDEGYHASLRSSYQIFDAHGHRVADRDLTSTEETCRNRRRDFFIVYDFHLPKRILPGKHTLRLTVEDLKGQKIGQSSVELMIEEKP